MTSSAPEALAAAPAPEWEQPDQRLERAEQTARLREAVLLLPERQRMALLLRTGEGLSYAEIGSAMDCSRSSVESLLFRARSALDKSLRK